MSRRRRVAPASIDFGSTDGDYMTRDESGELVPCTVDVVTATCLASPSGYSTEAYGAEEDSQRAALAMLTEECDCGARWHYESAPEAA